MTIPTQEKLEEALAAYNDNPYWSTELEQPPKEGATDFWHIRKAAAQYSKLLRLHGPDSIQSLLEGRAWVAPKEANCEMRTELRCRIDQDGSLDDDWWQAMRQAAKEKRDE